MNKSDAIEFFGTQTALAQAIGIGQSSVAEWGEDIPALRQIQLERITKGALKADPTCYGPTPLNGSTEQAAA